MQQNLNLKKKQKYQVGKKIASLFHKLKPKMYGTTKTLMPPKLGTNYLFGMVAFILKLFNVVGELPTFYKCKSATPIFKFFPQKHIPSSPSEFWPKSIKCLVCWKSITCPPSGRLKKVFFLSSCMGTYYLWECSKTKLPRHCINIFYYVFTIINNCKSTRVWSHYQAFVTDIR